MAHSERLQLAVLTVLSFAILFLDAHVKELHGTAVFYASLIREVVESGDPMGIYTDDRAYLLKPPLLVWASALSAKIFGLTNFGVTFVSRIAGVGVILLTYFFVRRWWGHAIAWIAAFAVLTNSTFVQFTATLRMDSLLMFGLLLSLLGWAYRDTPWSRAALYGGITLAVLSKGPLGFAAVPMIVCHAWLAREPLFTREHWPWMLLLLLLPIAAWYGSLFALHGLKPFFELGADTVRATAAPEFGVWQSIYHEYVVKPLRRYWPWLPLMVIGAGLALGRALDAANSRNVRANYWWLLIWFGVVLLGAALKPDHDIRYFYPALPVLGIFVGLASVKFIGERLPNAIVLGCTALIAAALLWPGSPSWRAPDSRSAIRAINQEIPTNPTQLAVGGYPVRLDQPRRQNTHRDWIHFYTGASATVLSWAQTRERLPDLRQGVFLTRSRGHEQRLSEFGLRARYITKEMIFAVPK